MADDEYNKKLESLQQYVPFLNKMISQLKDPTKPNREQQLAKIRSLHSMITENKKLKLATLTKCEEVILQLVNKAKSKSHTVEEPPTCVRVTTPESTVVSEVKERPDVAEERPASPSYTPPKKPPIKFSIFPKQKIHSVSNKDPATKIFVEKPSVFDRLGTRVFYRSQPVFNFDRALAGFREKLKSQGIGVSTEDKLGVEKSPLRIIAKATDECEEENKEIKENNKSESEEKESEKRIERSEEKDLKKERPRWRTTSEDKEKSKKCSTYEDYKDGRKDVSEEREDSRKGRIYDTYRERPMYKKPPEAYKRRTFRDTSEETEDSKTSPVRRSFKKSSEEREDSKSRYRYKDRQNYKGTSEERKDSKNDRIRDKYRPRRRETSEDTDDSKTSPNRDKYKESRKFRRSSEERTSLICDKFKDNRKFRRLSEERTSPICDKFKGNRKFRRSSEERTSPICDRFKEIRKFGRSSEERTSPICDKFKDSRKFRRSSEERTSPTRNKFKESRKFRRSSEEKEVSKNYNKYREKSKHRDTSEERENRKSRSYDEYYKGRQKIREQSEEKRDLKSSYDKYAERRRIKEERRKSVYSRYIYKSSRRETDRDSWTETRHKIKISTSNKYDQIRRDRRKTPSASELARVRLKYRWVNPDLKTRVEDIPKSKNVKLEDIPLPTEDVEKSPNPPVSDVSESSMHDVDITPVDMVLSPIRGDNEICVENPITTSLPFPFPTETIKSESSESSNNQTLTTPISIVVPNATIEVPALSNSYWNYRGSSDQETPLQNPSNEIQQLDYYPRGSVPISSYTDQAPPVLSPQYDYQRSQQRLNRNELRVLREFTEQPSKNQQDDQQKSIDEVVVKKEEVATVPQPNVPEPKPNDVQESNDVQEPSNVQEPNEDEKQMDIINKFLKKLMENEHTRAAVSVFIENVSDSLDDDKLKTAVSTVMSPKKQSKVNKGRIVNRKLVLDDDDDVDSSKETAKKKQSKPVIDDDETEEEEVTSTVQDDRKQSAAKKKKSELDLLHEDLRGMFIHDGMLTTTGKRMCCLLKDDTESDAKTSPKPERRTRSLTKKFDMKSSENQQQLRILRSARVVIPVSDNINKGRATNKADDTDEDENFRSIRRSRKTRCIEDSEEEHNSPKRPQKTSVDKKIDKARRSSKLLKKYVDDDSEDDMTKSKESRKKEYALRQSNKISWSYAEDDSDGETTVNRKARGKGQEYPLRQSGKVCWSYADEDSDNDEASKRREEYSLRESNKVRKSYVEIGSDDERIIKKVSKERNQTPKESPKKSSPDDKNVKTKDTSCKDRSPKKKQEQKAKVEEKTPSPHKIIRRKKISQWALGVIPKLKKKKKDCPEETKSAEAEETGTPLELIEPDKNYCAPQARTFFACRLCSFKGRAIAQHYKQEHPEYEVLCSRLQPNQAEKAIKASNEQKLEESEDYALHKSIKYPFQCCFCEFKMDTTVSFFYDHVSRHTGEFRHMCSECPFGCAGSKSLRAHYLKIHKKPRDNKPIVSNITTEVYGYLCLECNYVQMNRRSVEDHVNIYHLGEGKKIKKINLSSIVISKWQDKKPLKKKAPEVSQKTPEVTKKAVTVKKKRTLQPNKSSESKEEPPVKKRKGEGKADTITLLSLLEDFEKNNERVHLDSQKEFAKRNEETTAFIANTKKNVSELAKAKETTDVTVSMKKSQSLTLSQLLSEKQIKQDKETTDDGVDMCSDLDRSQDEKRTKQEKRAAEMMNNSEQLQKIKIKPVELSESMKKKWQSLNLDELTIKILKKGDACASEASASTSSQVNDVSSILHTTEDLDKKESFLEGEEMEQDNDFNSEPEEDETKEAEIEKVEQTPKSPVKKLRKIDMSVFTGKTDLVEENEKIDQERLKKMMQLNETIKKKRQSFSIVEQLSSRLLQESKAKAEEKMPVLEHLKETKPSTLTSLTVPQKTAVGCKDKGAIVMSAGFFDVFKKSNELEFVCRVAPCSFASKYRDTFVTHLNKEHVKINDEYKITQCSACQGKLLESTEKGFLRNFFVHMVEKHLNINDTDSGEIVPKEETINSSVTQGDDTVMRVGLLDIIKGTNTLKYVCRVVFCTFTSVHRNAFITHWTQEHPNFRMTQCRLCGSEVAASAGNCLVSTVFTHLDEEHLSVKSRKLQEKPFPFEISEVISIDDDPTPPPSPAEEQNFVIESVISLAEEADQKKSKDPTPTEDNPSFVIEDVVSLADDLESPGTSTKDQPSFVIENVTSVVDDPPPDPKQDTSDFVIENVVSLAEAPRSNKSESALQVFLQHPMEIYKCPQYYCHFVCESRNFFDMHVKAHGISNNKLISCVYCDVKTVISNSGHHIDTHHQNCLYSCSQCLYRALRKEYVMIHMKLKHKKASQIISLPKPLKMYTSQVKSFALNETCHAYKCGSEGCHAEFLFQSDFSAHLINTHGGRMVCGYADNTSVCSYRCANADRMIDHWRSHNCYSFHCLICQVGTMELYTMLEHYSFIHPNRRPNIVDRRRGPMNEIHGYNGRAFARIKYVTNEIFSSLGARHYNIVNATKVSEVIQIEDESDKTIDRSNLSEEMLVKKFGAMCEAAEKELKCPLCAHFKTKKISYFVYHLFLELKYHRFRCKSCNYSCITYGAMVIHSQDDHKSNSLSNVIECPIDENVRYWIELVINYQAKAITSKYSFERGEESQSVFRSTQCDICQKWFRDIDTLHEHQLYHWAELVYICGLCRARRPTLNEVLQHSRIAHSRRDCLFTRIPSVNKVISSWKSLKSGISQPKEESVTGFQRLQQNSDSQQVLILPSSTVGQQDAALYACLHCPTTVKSVEMLQKHNVEAHNGKSDDFKCKVLTKSKVEVMLLTFVLP